MDRNELLARKCLVKCRNGLHRAIQGKVQSSTEANAGSAYGCKVWSTQFSLVKAMAVKWREFAELVCVDDKAIIPVGEPQRPVSTGVRAHHGLLVPNTSALSALDHDFHVCGLVPSVLFHIDIPESITDSFYSGHLHMTVKDKIFQPSSAVRHAAELINIVRSTAESGEESLTCDGLNLRVPILLVYSDGGPDHRTTYNSVQVAWLAVFLALDLDLLVAARTAPSQSYANPAERSMSLFNLALQNVALNRSEMPEKFESMMKSLGTIKAVRAKAEKVPELKDKLLEAMKPVVTVLNERFTRLKWKEVPVQVHGPCTSNDVHLLLELLKVVEADINLETCLNDKESLAEFMNGHCKKSHYMFQIKKCGDCAVCAILPPRLPEETFADLHFVPDPVLNGEGMYKDFDEVYGTPMTDSDRPSLKEKTPKSDRDKQFKETLVSGRDWIKCSECDRRRVVYCASWLSQHQAVTLAVVKEELVYVCGNTLYADGHTLRDTLLVRESITCDSPMEVPYYSAVTRTFEPVCSVCGGLEIYHGPEIDELRKQYGTVRPICKRCLDKGEQPLVRSSLKVGKKRKAAR